VRGRDLIRQVLEGGISTREFRAMDVESAIDVILAPQLMLTIWRYSMVPCDCGQQNPETYLKTYVDLLLNGLLTKELSE
jgi:hypothetical protein